MSFARRLVRGWRALTHRRDDDREVTDEVQDYLDRTVAAHSANGMTPADALRAARMELGTVTTTIEQVREHGWENSVEMLLADIRYAARRLRRSPGFTAVSVITLALGIGATAAIFGAVNPILFRALPYPHAERVVSITDLTQDGQPVDVTFGTYRELLARNHTFVSMAPLKSWQPTIVGDAEPERLNGERVGAGYFRTLGVPPAKGRDLAPDDDRPGAPNVVILSDALWHRRFSADPGIVGTHIRLDDADAEVIGVMPARFENVLGGATDVWAPLQYKTVYGPDDREWGHHLRLVARLQPDATLDQARRDLNAIAHSRVPESPRVPWASLSNGLGVTSLQADVVSGVRPALLALIGAVLLVLAIACVNVTNLLLARGAQQRGEFAMRAALGAGRGRLVRQLLTESVLLALVGGVLGMFVAEVGVRTIVSLSPPGLPRVDAIRVDGTVFAFGLLVTTVIGVIVGAVPALHATRADLQSGLQQGSRRTAGGHQATRGVLVVAEVALALVVLVGAGLLFRSIERVFSVDVGFEASHLVTMQLQETGQRFRDDTAKARLYTELVDAMRAVPGVEAAALTSLLPQNGAIDVYGVHFESDATSDNSGVAMRYAVTPGYFATMRIPLRRGRLLDAHDVGNAPRAVVINESFARRRFRARDPLGQRLRFGPDDGRWYSIVGVVGDVSQSSLDTQQPDEIYITSTQWHWVDNAMSLVVRGNGDAAALTPVIRRAIWSVDKDVPIIRVATMETLVGRSVADRRFALILFEAFGVVALLLSATGIYGVLAGSVAERTREIGVRAALGASRASILGLVVRQGMTLTGLGVVIGLAGAAAATQAITAMLFGVSRLDPVTYGGVIVLLTVVAMAACGVPAWRAARVDPARTLRAD